MVAVKAGDVEGVLRRPDPRILVYLVYGPDGGLVNERAKKLAERAVDDPADPFQLIRLDGDAVAAEPGRLADEAGTIGLFGGRRAIWVKPTGRNIAPAVEAVLDMAAGDAAVVIEAGDLGKASPLRTLCERSQKALALPCYADTDRDLGTLVDDTFREAGIALTREARAAILANLGGDRLATRGELAKLLLYAHGKSEVGVEDVDAILSDVSSLALDAVVDAAFAGDAAGLEAGCRRLAAEGVAGSTILSAALRHALALLPARLDVEAGRPAGAVLEAWRGLHFRRKPLVQRHLERWAAGTLKEAVARIQGSLLDTRRLAGLGDAITARTLLDLARLARRA
ncbi:MAG TPA: DNA polymerase III subunit delta [Microvirga sp.]|jgi:DNA polymerase-3 subunit delta|nr:DNA polymerase III subunit delta [Microvirga sp.]